MAVARRDRIACGFAIWSKDTKCCFWVAIVTTEYTEYTEIRVWLLLVGIGLHADLRFGL